MSCRTIDEVVAEISCHIQPNSPPIHVARAVYDWEIANIRYDHVRLNNPFRTEILPPEETLNRGRGVCTDMAALYVVITRKLGLQSHYAVVEIDEKDKQVNHACAVVKLPRELQVDPAYRVFDAHHRLLHIIEPNVLAHGAPQRHYRRPDGIPQRIAAGIAGVALLGFAAMIASSDAFPDILETQNMEYRETSKGYAFSTKHGELEFTQESSARKTWKEALFYHEAQKGNMDAEELLRMTVDADKNADNHISHEEALNSRINARKKYLKD